MSDTGINIDDFLTPRREPEEIDIMQDRAAFLRSERGNEEEDNTPVGFSDEERRLHSLTVVVTLHSNGYIIKDPIAAAARVDHWLLTGQDSPPEALPALAEPSPVPDASPEVQPVSEAPAPSQTP